MNKLIILFIIFLSSNAFSENAETLGRGGTNMGDASMTEALFYTPQNLARDNSEFDIEGTLVGSESFIRLVNDDHTLQNDYERRLQPYFGSAINAYGQGSVGFNYKGFSVAPYLIHATGSAVLNDPAYPYADVSLEVSKGYGVGYGEKIGKFFYGASIANFNTEVKTFQANVLNYQKLSDEVDTGKSSQMASVGFGYQIDPKISLMTNYHYSNFTDTVNTVSIGSKINILPRLTFYGELQELEKLDLLKSLRAGVDITVIRGLILKLGSSEGYASYGASINLWLFKINAASSGHNQFETYRKEYRDYSVDLSVGYNL